ncbi:MAG: flavin reductase [Desulfurococcales archaeon ex4484_58]|nr:MAG: flavin reductase [Desulfurococcales archaeon ex4484_58]
MYVDIDPEDYHVLHPRPVYLIVSRKGDRLNVMSASWVTPVSDDPPLVAVSIWRKSLTYEYIMESKEFTINVVNDSMVNIVYRAGTVSGREIDKFRELGLEVIPSKKIKTPGVKDVLGFLECVLEKSVMVGESDLLIARVVATHVDQNYYERYGWNLRKTSILLHAGGKAFVTTGRLVFPSKK